MSLLNHSSAVGRRLVRPVVRRLCLMPDGRPLSSRVVVRMPFGHPDNVEVTGAPSGADRKGE